MLNDYVGCMQVRCSISMQVSIRLCSSKMQALCYSGVHNMLVICTLDAIKMQFIFKSDTSHMEARHFQKKSYKPVI